MLSPQEWRRKQGSLKNSVDKPGKKSDADREDTDEVEDWVQEVLLNNPVGVGGWVASDTQGSKSQGEEEVRQDATNDDQHVDPRQTLAFNDQMKEDDEQSSCVQGVSKRKDVNV